MTQTPSREHVASWYAATANPAPERPALSGEIDCDVCVVGAGFTGLSSALHLAERGLSVVVLEASRVGFGASGRNGGFLAASLTHGLGNGIERFTAEVLAEKRPMLSVFARAGWPVVRRFNGGVIEVPYVTMVFVARRL